MKKQEQEAGRNAPAGAEEGGSFLERWSRLKSRSRAADPEDVPAPPHRSAGAPAPAAVEAELPGDDAMPPLDSLTADSDYSAFFSPRVSAELRRAALRKLFHSAKFNVCDGLDDYCRDYTRFEPLGDVLTADMRHQIERAAQAALAADTAGDGDEAQEQAPLDKSALEPDDDRSEPA